MHTARFGYWETCTWLKDWNKRPIRHGAPREFSRFARVTGDSSLICKVRFADKPTTILSSFAEVGHQLDFRDEVGLGEPLCFHVREPSCDLIQRRSSNSRNVALDQVLEYVFISLLFDRLYANAREPIPSVVRSAAYPPGLSIIGPTAARARSRFLGVPRGCAYDALVILFGVRVAGRHIRKPLSPCNLLVSARHVVVPVHERALGVVPPRPNVEFEERR